MKTNFEYLNKQISNLKVNNDSDVYRYLRDLEFLLKDVEKKIYLREFMSATYPLRMSWDLSRDFILYMLKHSKSKHFIKWNDNIKKMLSKFDIRTKPGYLNIWRNHPSHVSEYIEGLGTYKEVLDIFTEMNGWMHYRYDTNHKGNNNAENKHDDSSLYSHRNVVRYSEPKMNQTIQYLETIWYVIVNMMIDSGMFEELDRYEFDFDREIYNTPEYALEKLMQYKEVDALISGRIDCPLCNQRSFNKPNIDKLIDKKIIMPHGAYIGCESEGCWAKIDSTLKLKKELKYEEFEDSNCTKCGGQDTLQKRYSLLNRDSGVYIACKKCNWNNKNEEIEDDIYEGIFEEGFDFNSYE